MYRIYLFLVTTLFLPLQAISQHGQKSGLQKADSLLLSFFENTSPDFYKSKKTCDSLSRFYDIQKQPCKSVNALLCKANFELKLGDYGQAFATLILAQKKMIPACSEVLQQEINFYHACLYQQTGDVKKVDSFTREAQRTWGTKWKDTSLYIKYLFVLGTASGNKNDTARQFQYFSKALQLATIIKYDYLLEMANSNLGVAYAQAGNEKKALQFFLQSLQSARKRNSLFSMGTIYNNIAGATENKIEGLKYIDSAIAVSKKIGDLAGLVNSLENKWYQYTLIEDYENAYIVQFEYTQLKDSLLNIQKLRAVADLQEKYEAEKKTVEIQTLKLEKADAELAKIRLKRNQVILLILAGFFLMAGTFIYIRFLTVRRNRNVLAEKNLQISLAREQSDELLRNILPAEVAEELKATGKSKPRGFDNVTVMFTDFVNFTGISAHLSPEELVDEIDRCFKAFDAIIEKNGLEKIKTIGDAYLAVAGLPFENTQHAKKAVVAAIEIRDFMAKGGKFNVRIGVHSGPVVAGIVGIKKFAYDIWGDTVNTAARMEQSSEAGKINITKETYTLLNNEFPCTYRGKIDAKNKGNIDMYFVN